MPLSFLTGFSGMNFASIPCDRRWLFALVVGVMLALPGGMLLAFARRGWLTHDRPYRPWFRFRAWLRGQRSGRIGDDLRRGKAP